MPFIPQLLVISANEQQSFLHIRPGNRVHPRSFIEVHRVYVVFQCCISINEDSLMEYGLAC